MLYWYQVRVFDPRGRPTVTAGSDHCFCTCRHFSKQNKFKAKTMFATGETVGQAEWIIDDTCLVIYSFTMVSTYNLSIFLLYGQYQYTNSKYS